MEEKKEMQLEEFKEELKKGQVEELKGIIEDIEEIFKTEENELFITEIGVQILNLQRTILLNRAKKKGINIIIE